MKYRQTIVLLIFFLLVFPFHNVKASSEFGAIIQYISAGEHEEGVKLLHQWYTNLEVTEKEHLTQEYSQLITTLSSDQYTQSQKIIHVWSFVSLSEYVTENNLEYMRFLAGKFNEEWSSEKLNSSGNLEHLNELYNAMVPTLQLIVDQGDMESMQSISEAVSGPLLISSNTGGSLPPFEQWYKEQMSPSTLILVSVITGAVVISTLVYVSWRKYDGVVRRKRMRDHND